ncbi:MAG: wax ester/triacylglycerol synthase domain-containing protein, partial [Microthrixaceae bacterium]
MERLSGLDANFLYNETPTEHMHTLKLAVLDPPDGDELPWELIRTEIASRMLTWPAFRRKVVRVPGDLNHPVWVAEDDPDMGYHLRRARIPSPGGAREMDHVVGRLAGWPLERDHPLWQVWMLDGRADGRIAVLVKVHHCVADGVAANALLASILSTEPRSNASPPTVQDSSPSASGTDQASGESEPDNRELLANAARDLVFDTIKLPSALWGLRGSLGRRRRATAELEAISAEIEGGGSADELGSRIAEAELPPRPVLDTPKTSFNRSITAARAVSTALLRLEPMLEVRSAAGVTLNDVLLTLVGGALARILHEGGEDPDRALTASVPVASDPQPEPGRPPQLPGNTVSNPFVSLHPELEDPPEQLAAVHHSVVG